MLTSIIIITLLLFSSNLYSEEIYLPLEDAFIRAEKNDTELLNAGYEVESGDAIVREATAAALPTISVQSSFNHFIETPTTFIPELGRIRFSPYNDMSADLHLSQPIWLAGKVGMALDAAKTYRKLARESELSSRASLKLKTTTEYFGLLLTHGVYEVTLEGLNQAKRHAETVKRMYDVGMASEFDLLRAQVEVKTLEPELSGAIQNRSLAYVSLTNRLGIPATDTLILTTELVAEQLPTLDTKNALVKATNNRPEFRLIDMQLRLDELSINNEARSLYWPNLFFDMNYRWQASEDDVKSFREDSIWAESLNYTISLQIPLFDGFATQARHQKARIGLRQTKLKRIQLEQGIRLKVTLAETELKRAREQVESMKAGVELAQKAYDISKVRYEEGISTELEVLDAQLALQRSKVGLLQGWYNLRVAQAEFGRIVENDTDLGGGD